jgi:Ca2+-binding EF-hand superfamily protein/8-oxo-dGTP pyrophosphatase MutT (NUDIX family)
MRICVFIVPDVRSLLLALGIAANSATAARLHFSGAGEPTFASVQNPKASALLVQALASTSRKRSNRRSRLPPQAKQTTWNGLLPIYGRTKYEHKQVGRTDDGTPSFTHKDKVHDDAGRHYRSDMKVDELAISNHFEANKPPMPKTAQLGLLKLPSRSIVPVMSEHKIQDAETEARGSSPEQNMSTLTSWDVDFADEAKQLFNELDRNGDGRVSFLELDYALKRSASFRKALKLWNYRDWEAAFINADTNHDGALSCDEFTKYLELYCLEDFNAYVNFVGAPPLLDEAAILEASNLYEQIDEDGDGQVTRDELKHAAETCPEVRRALALWSRKECTDFLDDADADSDGVMSFEEFVAEIASTRNHEFREYVSLVRGYHPKYLFEPKKLGPARRKHAQVIILRERPTEANHYDVLLQRRSLDKEFAPGQLAGVGGKRDRTDQDSLSTAMREIYEETGLLDILSHPDAPSTMFRSLVNSTLTIPNPPRLFLKFQEGKRVDWFVLLLDGSGSFGTAADASGNADFGPMLDKIPFAVLAPCFGHAWVPIERLHEIPMSTKMFGGLRSRVSDAWVAMQHNMKESGR